MRRLGLGLCVAGLSLVVGCVQVLGIGDDEQDAGGGGGPADAAVDPDAPPESPDAAPGTVGIAPATLAVRRGESATVEVSLSRGAGVTGAATITVSGLPAGVTAAPLTIDAGAGTGELTVTATGAATLGEHVAMITAQIGDLEGTAALTVRVRAQPGVLDPDFGGGGVVSAAGARAVDLVLDGDRAVVVGWNGESTFATVLTMAGTVSRATTSILAGSLPETAIVDGERLLIAGWEEHGTEDESTIVAFDDAFDLAPGWGTSGVTRMGSAAAQSFALTAVPLDGTLMAGVAIDGAGAFAEKLDNGVKVGSRTNLGSTTDLLDATKVGARVVAVGFRPSGGNNLMVVRSFIPGATTSSEIGPQTTGCVAARLAAIADDTAVIVGRCGSTARMWQIKLNGSITVDTDLDEVTGLPVGLVIDAAGIRYVLDEDGVLSAYDSGGVLAPGFASGGRLDLTDTVPGLIGVALVRDAEDRLWVLGTTGQNAVVLRVLL